MGNTFDFPALHGRALRANGYSFSSAARDALTSGAFDLGRYRALDLILGEQRQTPWPRRKGDPLPFAAFPPPLCSALSSYLGSGGRIFLSGAYIATDPSEAARHDSTALILLRDWLHYGLSTGYAARGGDVVSVQREFLPGESFAAFQSEGDEYRYGVEAPDALVPLGGAQLLLRYAENGFGAAVGYRNSHRVVAFGFPFESILQGDRRNAVMGAIMGYLFGP